MDKRLLTIQDISCVGQCSLTVALPVISACGIEAGILPSSVLSNHTAAGFSGWTFCDLTQEMPKILDRWQKEHIDFDAFYTGYVSKAQIPYILEIMEKAARPGALRIVDPAMADNGVMYSGFGTDFPAEMTKLCKNADVIIPNITEACFLLGIPYIGSQYDEKAIEKICRGLHDLGTKNVIITGVSFSPEKLGCVTYDGSDFDYYFTERIPVSMHGTGDVYASVVAGCLCRGIALTKAAALAADFVVESIKKTADDKSHWYGVKFEKAIPYLVRRLEEEPTC